MVQARQLVGAADHALVDIGRPVLGDRRGAAHLEDGLDVSLDFDGAGTEARRQIGHRPSHDNRGPMLRILRQPNFAKLWFGGLISMTGDWILIVGLPFEIYRRTGSTLATGAMVLAFLIPSILLGSVAGVFVDRWDRQRLMVVINLIMAVILLPMLAIDALGIWIAYVVLFVGSSLELLFRPAEGALLPNLLENPDDDLVTANALNGLNNHLARLIGPAIGGIIVATGGLVAVTVIDAVSFLLAAALIASIRTSRGRAERHDSLEHEALNAWRRCPGRVARWPAHGSPSPGPASAARLLRDHPHR